MQEDLTTRKYWDSRWTRRETGVRGWVGSMRERARDTRGFAALLAGFIDRAGTRPVKVLELGCAPGNILDLIHAIRPGHELHGIDYAERGVERTRARFSERGIPVEIHHGDLRTLELATRFDLVLSCGLVEHFRDPMAVMRHHARFARPGGRVAITVPDYSHPFVHAALRRCSPETLETHVVEVMAPDALARIFRDAGLREVETGRQGPPLLPLTASRPGVVGTGYKIGGRLWNMTAWTLPTRMRPWTARVWGIARRAS